MKSPLKNTEPLDKKYGRKKVKISVYKGQDGWYRVYQHLPTKRGTSRGKVLYVSKSRIGAIKFGNNYMKRKFKNIRELK